MHRSLVALLAVITTLFISQTALATPAFLGAEGFGALSGPPQMTCYAI